MSTSLHVQGGSRQDDGLESFRDSSLPSSAHASRSVRKPNTVYPPHSAGNSAEGVVDSEEDLSPELLRQMQELDLQIKDLSSENDFLKKKNHELTYRVLQLEREKNDRACMKEAEQWYSQLMQRTAPGNAKSGYRPQPHQSSPTPQQQQQQTTGGKQQQQQQQSNAQVQQQQQQQQYGGGVSEAKLAELQQQRGYAASMGVVTNTPEFLAVYQNIYQQYQTRYPTATPQALAVQSETQALSYMIKQRQTTGNQQPTLPQQQQQQQQQQLLAQPQLRKKPSGLLKDSNLWGASVSTTASSATASGSSGSGSSGSSSSSSSNNNNDNILDDASPYSQSSHHNTWSTANNNSSSTWA